MSKHGQLATQLLVIPHLSLFPQSCLLMRLFGNLVIFSGSFFFFFNHGISYLFREVILFKSGLFKFHCSVSLYYPLWILSGMWTLHFLSHTTMCVCRNANKWMLLMKKELAGKYQNTRSTVSKSSLWVDASPLTL